MFPFQNLSGGTSDFLKFFMVSLSYMALQTGNASCLAPLAMMNMPATAIRSPCAHFHWSYNHWLRDKFPVLTHSC